MTVRSAVEILTIHFVVVLQNLSIDGEEQLLILDRLLDWLVVLLLLLVVYHDQYLVQLLGRGAKLLPPVLTEVGNLTISQSCLIFYFLTKSHNL